jgi:hypothetical protein
MNCNTHTDRTALSVCVNCGAAMCKDCCKRTPANKLVCSSECAAASNVMDEAIATITSRSGKSSRATAWFCWLAGGLFGVLGGLYLLGGGEDRAFAFYLLASFAVFMFIGFWFKRIGKQASNTPLQPTPASGRG